jgi:hypothetical protein
MTMFQTTPLKGLPRHQRVQTANLSFQYGCMGIELDPSPMFRNQAHVRFGS